jgi:hypothetical protein
MPEISRFFGIVITMYYDDHAPPHFHARYGGDEIKVEIENGRVLAGRFSPRLTGLVQEWLVLHRNELQENWRRARQEESLERIDGLG